MCPSKHVEPSINFEIINSITKLHLVGISTESSRATFHDYCEKIRVQQAFTSHIGTGMNLTLRLLMSYIYIYMEHLFLVFLDHTQRRSTVGRTPLDE